MSLIASCKKGDLEGVKAALKSGIDVNTMDEDGYTGLMLAISFNHNSVVKLLLKTPNIDVNQKNDWGSFALNNAVYNSNIEALKLLLDFPSIDVNSVDNYGNSLVGCHKIDVLKLLLSHPGLTSLTLNQKQKKNGATPVMVAAMRNKLEHLAILAGDLRVDLDTKDKEGRSLEDMARSSAALKIIEEAKQERRLIKEQKRRVLKVLLEGLYDPDSQLSKLLGVCTEVVGEIIWKKMLVWNWQIFPAQ